MAWGMFLAIPCPFRRWDEAARGRMLGFLPLIGLIVGAIWAAAARLCTALNLPSAVRALILCALPWLVTGFLHLDGFMDVCDAVLSRRDLETRQRILKDSHCGSFAVICMILLAAAQWSLFFSFESFDFKALLTLAVLPACTRACSGIAVQTLKPMQTSQYSGAVRSAASVVSLFVQLALFLVFPPLLCTPLAPTGTSLGRALQGTCSLHRLSTKASVAQFRKLVNHEFRSRQGPAFPARWHGKVR